MGPQNRGGVKSPPPGCATGIASTASYLSRDRRPDRSIAEKSRSTLTCVTGSATSVTLAGPQRSGVGWDDVPHIAFCKKKKSTNIGRVINGGSRERALGGAEFQTCTQCMKST